MRALLVLLMLGVGTTVAGQTPAPVHLAGHVIEGVSGMPIDGARVRITPVGSPMTPPGLKILELTTGADGAFALELPSARYMITASRPGYTPVPLPFDSRFFSFAPGDTIEDLRLAMYRGGSMAGRVVDTEGRPLGDFVVTAMPRTYRNGRIATERGIMTRTADDGSFQFPGLPPHDYVVAARPSNPKAAVARLNDGRLAHGPTFYPAMLDLQKAERVALAPGDVITGIEITVQPAPTFEIQGIVVDARGAPAARARLMLGWNPENPGAGTRPSQETYTAMDGTFRFDAPADIYRLDAVLPSFTPPPGGTDIIMMNPDGRSIYILQNSPRASMEIDLRGRMNGLKLSLRD